ncbi:TPA: hypothetical protein ACPJ0C_004929, partial [Vibrio alginolyticus]
FFSDSADMIHRHPNWVAFFYLYFLFLTHLLPSKPSSIPHSSVLSTFPSNLLDTMFKMGLFHLKV